MLISELYLPKNKWITLLSHSAKQEAGSDLIDLVSTAYQKSAKGSFVKNLTDVLASDWKVISWDDDPEIDAAVFYRAPRRSEPWHGYKIQGIGHDNQPHSKSIVMNKVKSLLHETGWWIESSDAMQKALFKLGCKCQTNPEFLRSLFPDSDLQMISDTVYSRRLPDGTRITESVFGYPVLA